MGGQSTICFSCQRALMIFNGSKLTRKYSGFPLRRREPYILPRLVIDLDSNDNKYVRKAEDGEPNGEPATHNEWKAKLDGYEIKGTAMRHIRLTPWENNGPLETRTTTPLDVLSYALEGNSREYDNARESHTQSALQDLCQERQINPTDKAEATIEQLLHGFSAEDESLNLKAAGFSVESDEAIIFQLQERYTSFRKFSRAISMLSSTIDGCRFLSANGTAVVAGIRSCRQPKGYPRRSQRRPSVPVIIRLLNNLHLNMKSKGMAIGPDICNAGLFYSAKAFELQALRTYLQIMVENNYPTNWYTNMAINKLLLSQLGSSETAQNLYNKLKIGIDSRQVVLRLITGCETDGVLPPIEERQPSFASLLRQDHNKHIGTNLYPSYILTLGKMGGSEALVQEYASIPESFLPQSLRGQGNSRRKACITALGLVLAQDHKNAAEVLKSGFAQGGSGCEGDVLWPVVMRLYKSHFIKVDPAFNRVLSDFVGNDWQNALDLIKRFVDHSGLFADKIIDRNIQLSVDWVDHDGTGQAVVKSNDRIGQAIIENLDQS